MKKALKQINTFLEKGEKKLHSLEKLGYKIVKVYVLDKSNRKQEALTDTDDIIKEILENNVNDVQILE
jgi:hypothetical protein